MNVRLLSVNFGVGKAGLSTVGYAIYNKSGSVKSANTTTGVAELGTSTGIYYANVTLDDNFDGIVLWTTGEASPRYGLEPTLAQLNSIQDETDHIRLIWNTLRNQGDLYQQLLKALDKLKGAKPKEYDKEFSTVHALLKQIDGKKFPEFPAIPAPIVNIPETKIPDYTNILAELKNIAVGIDTTVKGIPQQHKDYTSDLLSITTNLERVLDSLETKLETVSSNLDKKINVVAKSDELKGNIGNLHYEIEKLKKAINDAQNKLNAVDANITNTMKPAKFLQDIYQIIKQSENLKQVTEQYTNKINNLKLAGF